MNNDYARNGVRIALNRTYKVLVPLFIMVVLSMAIIFVGLNTTNNIAYASLSDGIVNSNLCALNYFNDKTYSGSSPSLLDTVYLESYQFVSENNRTYYNNVFLNIGSASNNTFYLTGGFLGGSLQIIISENPNSNIRVNFNTTMTIAFYASDVSNMNYFGSNNTTYTMVEGLNTCTIPSATAGITFKTSLSTTGTSSFTLHWLKFEYGSEFTGYVKNDYYNYGYNQGVVSVNTQSAYDEGYSDGVASIDTDAIYDEGYDAGYNAGLDTDAFDEGYNTGYDAGYDAGIGSIYTGEFSDYTILSDYSSYGVNNNDLNVSSFTLTTNNNYTEFNFNGSTICNNYVRVVGSNDNSGSYTITYTRSAIGTYVGALVSSFYIDENSLYKFLFNPDDYFNIVIAVFSDASRTSQYLQGYWTYELTTDGYINGVPYMDLTPYIKVWAMYPYCNIYLYNPNVWSGVGEPNSLVLHNTTPIYGLVSNNLIVDNSNGNYNQGFSDGKKQGNSIGYRQGYDDAMSARGNTFLGLFSAVLDAPVSVISDTLNFELLGFNLKDFFFSMVSIAIILFILRLIL